MIPRGPRQNRAVVIFELEGFPLRMSGIVVGGLLGAAAAMYLSRSNKTFSFSGISSATQALDSMVEKARSKMMSPDKRSYYGDNASASGSQTSTTSNMNMSGMSMSGMGATNASSSSQATGIDQVESIVKQDPALKSQVNDILSESRDAATIR
jgi:gas vesicle protein